MPFGAIAPALVVIIPVFLFVKWISDDGKRLKSLVIVVFILCLARAPRGGAGA